MHYRDPRPSRTSAKIFAAACILVLASLVAYLPSFAVPFFFDDKDAIIDNPTIRQWRNVADVLAPPNDGGGVTGRPLVNASLAINYALGGASPFGYHIANFALHAAATLALFGAVRHTLCLYKPAPSDGEAILQLSWLIALLWTLHPLQTESVSCVIQRTELLVGLFYLTSFYCFARYIGSPGSRRWPVLTVIACLAGMASKEVMVSAPLLLLFYDRTFAAGTFAGAWRSRRSLYIALGCTWLLLAVLLLHTGGSRGTSAGFGLGVSWWAYLLKQCEAILIYLRLCVWPFPQVIDYGNAVDAPFSEVIPQGLFLIAMAAATVALCVRRSALGFLGLWFFAILAPSSSFVPLVTQTIAEHRMYLPLAAVVAALVAGWQTIAARSTVLLVPIAVALGLLTYQRNSLLADEVALWRQCVDEVPTNPRALDNLALAHCRAGRYSDAIPLYEKALALNPSSASSHAMLGDAYLALNQLSEAERHFRQALALSPAQRNVANNLATLLRRAGRFDEALVELNRAVAQDPHNVDARSNLGLVLIDLGKPAEAAHAFEIALGLDPRHQPALAGYGDLLLARDEIDAAISRYRAALSVRPDAATHNNLALALLRANRPEEAAEHCRQALALNPRLPQSRNNYGIALARLGRLDEAIGQFEEAVRVDPNYADARDNLARIRAAQTGKSADR